MTIDSHVHLRDFKQTHKETIAHGLEVALDSGLDAVFDMPNTNPAVLSAEHAKQRIQLARDSGVKRVFYGTFIGLTSNPEQIKNAVQAYRDLFPHVVGFKLYAGHSTGQLGVIGLENQRIVYETLAREGYEGILFVHCEKEEAMEAHKQYWNPKDPVTHCMARPGFAELESIEDQFRLSRETNFRGKLHIAHVSLPASVDLINQAKKQGMNVSSGVTPHHIIHPWTRMRESDGLQYKVNPPLRKPNDPKLMLEKLRNGEIDWIETDHAPHTSEEKTGQDCASGLVCLPFWSYIPDFLRKNDFSEERILEVNHLATMKRFEIDIEHKNKPIKDRTTDYNTDYFADTKNRLNLKIN